MKSCVSNRRFTYGLFGLVLAAVVAAVGYNGLSLYAKSTHSGPAWYATASQTENGRRQPRR